MIWLMLTYTHPHPRLIACTNTHSSLTLTGAFPLHAPCVIISQVWIAFLVRDSRIADHAWSARFLVLVFVPLKIPTPPSLLKVD